jgi:hypothetical protein
MKEETLEKAIELNEQLVALEKFASKLDNPNEELVYITMLPDNEVSVHRCNVMDSIMKAHDVQIRTELEVMIQNIKKEIEQL